VDEQRDIVVNGIRLAYTVHGPEDKLPMLLLHALGESGADWAPVTTAFTRHFQLITPDLRGHGASEWTGRYAFRLMSDDILAFVDALELPEFTLVGHSMGAAVAYLVAMSRPEQVEYLITEDAPPLYERSRPVPERPEGELPFDWAVVPAIVEAVNAGDQAMWDGLRDITAPTLLIGGGSLSYISQEKLAQAAALIPDSTLVTIEAGHNVHRRCPEEFIAAVFGWLGLS
jgi:pimeloyl-ACP methyl ester carboxylesterase